MAETHYEVSSSRFGIECLTLSVAQAKASQGAHI